MTALMGVHTLGKADIHNSGFHGTWVNNEQVDSKPEIRLVNKYIEIFQHFKKAIFSEIFQDFKFFKFFNFFNNFNFFKFFKFLKIFKLFNFFQDFELFYDRTVAENLHFVMRATGWKDKSKMKKRLAEVLMRVGLGAVNNKMPHQLSGGEQQK